MDRRTFIKGLSAGAALAGFSAAGELFIPFAEAADIPTFAFAHLTDLHLDVNYKGEGGYIYREKSVPLFMSALRQMQRLPKLSFVVFGGDQIHYGPNDKASLEVFQKWAANLNMPYYVLLGNTEVSPASDASLGRADYLKAWSGKGLRPGHSSWAFTPARGVRAIGFDVTIDGKAHGEAGDGALKWLEDELKANKSKKLIMLFTHQLLAPTTPKDTTRNWSLWMVRNHEKVRAVLARYRNVRLVVSGHHHAAKVVSEGRITYVADPAVASYPCAFRYYSVSRKGIYLKSVSVDEPDLIARARELLVTDPYARMYDAAAPQKAADYSRGETEQDRQAMLKL